MLLQCLPFLCIFGSVWLSMVVLVVVIVSQTKGNAAMGMAFLLRCQALEVLNSQVIEGYLNSRRSFLVGWYPVV